MSGRSVSLKHERQAGREEGEKDKPCKEGKTILLKGTEEETTLMRKCSVPGEERTRRVMLEKSGGGFNRACLAVEVH